MVFPPVEFMDDPDLWLSIYTKGDSRNWGRMSDPKVEDLFARQARTLDPVERKKLVNEIDKIVLENAYYIPGLWWTRNLVHWAKVKNYVAPPNLLLQPEAPGRLALRGLSGARDRREPGHARQLRHRRDARDGRAPRRRPDRPGAARQGAGVPRRELLGSPGPPPAGHVGAPADRRRLHGAEASARRRQGPLPGGGVLPHRRHGHRRVLRDGGRLPVPPGRRRRGRVVVPDALRRPPGRRPA